MATTQEDASAIYKVAIVGVSHVGKTSLLQRFVDGTFGADNQPTLMVETALADVELENGKKVKLQLWDTAGQERFRAVAPSYYRHAVAAILVYDVCDYSSFESLPSYLKEIQRLASKDVIVMLVGNKTDESDRPREVETREAYQFAQRHNFALLETSAKTGAGVETAFVTLAQEIDKRHSSKPKSSPETAKPQLRDDVIDLTVPEKKKEKCSCQRHQCTLPRQF